MLCILYVNVVGFLLCTFGALIERVRPTTISRRAIWCVILVASLALPGYYRYHHAFAVAGASEGAMITLGAGVMTQIRAIDLFVGRAWLTATGLLGVWALVNLGWVSHLVRVSRERLRSSSPSAIGGVPVVITESLGPATVGVGTPGCTARLHRAPRGRASAFARQHAPLSRVVGGDPDAVERGPVVAASSPEPGHRDGLR